MAADRQGLLKKIDFFSSVPGEVLSKVALISEVVSEPSGKLLFSQGDSAEFIWGVLRGKVKLYKLSFNGKQQTVAIADEGETFGEIAALKGQVYPVYAEAMEDVDLVKISGEGLYRLIKEEPQVALGLVAAMAEKLKHLTDMIERLSLKEVPERLADYILRASGGKDILLLDISKGELARLLGTTPETLSRSFRKLSKLGVIDVRGSMIRILSRQHLEEVAEGLPPLT